MGGSTRSSGPLLGRESWCLPVWWRATHISLLAACSMQLIHFSWCQPHPGRALVPNLADACPSRPRQHVSRHSVFQRLTCLLRTDTATHTTPHHTTTNKTGRLRHRACVAMSLAPLRYDRRHHATCRSVEAATWGCSGLLHGPVSVAQPDPACWPVNRCWIWKIARGACRLEKVACVPCG
jgi:hypothetical protein